jgi:hypothetical protein
LKQRPRWELEELFENLILEDRFGDKREEVNIFGARFETIEGLENNQNSYLQQICNQSERIIRKIGPTQAVADRSKENCDLNRANVKYHGTESPEPAAGPTNATLNHDAAIANATNGSEADEDHSALNDRSPLSDEVDTVAGPSESGGVRRYLRDKDASHEAH